MSNSPVGVVELADRISALLYGIAGWLTVGFGLLMTGAALTFGYSVAAGTARVDAVVGAGLFALFLLLAGLVTVALGLFVNPRFRRRLDRRHGLSRFGRVRSVDRRVVRPEEGCLERCVDCGDRIRRPTPGTSEPTAFSSASSDSQSPIARVASPESSTANAPPGHRRTRPVR